MRCCGVGAPQPNQALEPTPYSLRFAPAFGRGSPRALDVEDTDRKVLSMPSIEGRKQ